MKDYEFDGLKRVGINPIRWGSDFRVKIDRGFGKKVYISNPSTSKNIKLLAKTYTVKEDQLRKHLSKDYKREKSYKVTLSDAKEEHLFEGFSSDEVYDKVYKLLTSKTQAFKVNIQLGYTLIDRINGRERDYWPSGNTTVWDKPIPINRKKDIDSKIMSYMHAKDFTEKISYPVSSYQLKEINAANVVIYFRNHVLGDNIKIPDCIKKNQYVVDFPNTNNKCMFYCLAYHLGGNLNKKRMVTEAKKRYKEFCSFENIAYSTDIYKNAQPIDIMQFDKLEDCFKLNIDVYEMNEDTLEVSNIRPSEKTYNNVINILEYKSHAMYITNLDTIQKKYPCNKCGSIFETCDKLRNHKKNKCQFETLESFCKKPTNYRPNENTIISLHRKYGVDCYDHYVDHFIVYDFEARMIPLHEQRGENSKYVNKHMAMSVSVCDSFTNQVKCFVNESPKQLLKDMFKYVDEINKKIADYNFYKFKNLVSAIKAQKKQLDNDNSHLMEGVTDDNIKQRRKEDPKLALYLKRADKITRDEDRLNDILKQIPLIGFNSGNYDINLNKKDLFAVLDPERIKLTIKNPGYMCISTDTNKILDITNYLPPATSYEKYLETYLGGCKCDDKSSCTCGLTKGVFCYEYITSFDKLNESALPQKSSFESKLNGTKISDEDYERVKFAWNHFGMKTVKDLLIWYNNLDVKPFVMAINKQREFFKRFDLDMFIDGVSLPGLAEKIMYQTSYKEIEQPQTKIREKIANALKSRVIHLMGLINPGNDQNIFWSIVDSKKYYTKAYITVTHVAKNQNSRDMIMLFSGKGEAKYVYNKLLNEFPMLKFDLDLSKINPPFSFPTKRIVGYQQQDKKANRQCDLTTVGLNHLLELSCFVCSHCNIPLTEENVSADRIDNKKGHTDDNVMISCNECNVARKDMNINAFRRQKFIDVNSHKLVYSIDAENADIYHKMKANIAGGPSIIFNRYAKRNETYIRNGDKLCKKIIGYDANALYLWCLGNKMPCGRLTTIEPYEGIIDDIQSSKIFGFLECDISTPEHLKDYFSEMTPIFKNAEIDPFNRDIVGDHMYEYNNNKNHKAMKSKKLIGSYFGTKILIYTPLLKWYLSHGMEVTKSYSFIKASSHKPFKNFMEQVSDARREGNSDGSKAMIAGMMKLVGNSAFGRSGMDKSKHKTTTYERDTKSVRALVEKQEFHDLDTLDGSYEVTLNKRRVKLNNPIHVSIAIYQLAKLRMLQFYYDCIDLYFDRSDFQYQEMDTDSGYIAFSNENPFENLIKPELRHHFEKHKNEWFPRTGSKEHNDYDLFTPGLFKEEWRGDAMVSLSSKNYMCYLPSGKHKEKVSAKGVQKKRNSGVLIPDNFEEVVKNRVCMKATNSGFRIDKETQSVITYEQNKVGLNYYYDKRQVLSDGISTKPLNI